MDIQEENKFMEEWKQKQQKEFEDSLPIPREIFQKLFDFLNEQSEENECHHTFDMTIGFLTNNNCPIDDVLAWLGEHGAGCDCEVIYNVEEYFE